MRAACWIAFFLTTLSFAACSGLVAPIFEDAAAPDAAPDVARYHGPLSEPWPEIDGAAGEALGDWPCLACPTPGLPTPHER